MTSWTKPTADQIDRALALLSQPQLTRKFFEGLKNPEWLAPLKGKGYFEHPPAAMRDEERGTIGFSPWPASEFLARMAGEAPAVVSEIILSVPETDNFRVHEDFVGAAMLMPPEMAARIATNELKWLRKQPMLFTLFPEKLGDLCEHLAAGGKQETALSLFSTLIEIRAKTEGQEYNIYRDREMVAHLDVWHYRDFLKKHLPKLVPLLGISPLKLLGEQLNAYMKIVHKETIASGRDHSYIWRPAIESHSQNTDGQLESALISGVRDAAELFLQAEPLRLGEALETINAYNWTVFKRLAIHLVRKFSLPKSPELLKYSTDQALFDDVLVRHEYVILLRERARHLPDSEVDKIFGWIDSGPDMGEWKKEAEDASGKCPDDAAAAKWRDLWQRERLAWFEEHLPERWEKHFFELLKRLPAPEHPDFPFHMSGGWVGPESPKTADELKALSVPNLAKLLSSWQPPSSSFMDVSREGLGRTLSEIIKAEPALYADEAKAFIGLDPTYVKSVIQAFEEATRAHATFRVDNLLDLCEWAVNQPREIEGVRQRGKDPHWGWARKTIASFLKFILQGETVELEKREQIWKILSPITADPDPTAEDEPLETLENSMGPETLSINTARGQAMHSVIQYALWVRSHHEQTHDVAAKIEHGFGEMPEVKEILDEHLEIDPSPAVRSVYGQWFPWLFLIDPAWARTAIPSIFPTREESDRCKVAAWLTYLTFCQPYDSVYEILNEQYSIAIENLGTNAPIKRRHGDPDERLGQHLASYYWRGKLDLTPESLFSRYLTRANDKTRASVIVFIGRSLQNTKEEAPTAVLTRIKNLWDWLVDSGPLADSIGPETTTAFGWWFSSKLLPDEWSVPRLLKSVQRAKKTEPEHLVATKLITTATKWPLESVGIFDVLAKNDKEGWGIMHWENQAMAVLETAYRSDSTPAKRAAHELINYLGSRGYERFGTILTGPPSA